MVHGNNKKKLSMNYELITHNQLGISMVEIVLVIATIVFLALTITSLPSAISSINKSRHASIAREITSREVEYLRKQTYANLPNGTSNFADPNLSNLPNYAATYEIIDCPVQICSSSEKIKKVTVKVSWNELTDRKDVTLVTMIGEGGVGQ